ncbi:MAG: hypothetical protein HY307_01520, partial [Arcobacter sp.]|nr:hypothetical protein [Arcobacter sp.]
NAINFSSQLLEKGVKTTKLIILDNVETLLYLEASTETDEIKKLIELISNYATIVITTREKVSVDGEKIYSLSDLTLDDAETLYLQKSGTKLRPDDRRFLRDTILDEMLNRNPLAIELVANLRLSPTELEEELRRNFFDTTTDASIRTVFANQSDLNISKSKSLYHSIGMSYNRLEEKHKRVFELLSLFPDGLHKKNFITFFNSKEQKDDKNKITYVDINHLEDKSIIYVSNDNIKLQSIVGRYAEQAFIENNEHKKYYYQKAFSYNQFIMDVIGELDSISSSKGARSFAKNKNNILKSLEYIHGIASEVKIVLFLQDILYYFSLYTSPDIKVLNRLYDLKARLSEFENKDFIFDSITLNLEYYYGDFEKSYKKIKEKYPIQWLLEKSKIDKMHANAVDHLLLIYDMEGSQYELQKLNEQFEFDTHRSSLIEIGEFQSYEKIKNTKHIREQALTSIEYAMYTNKLDINDVKKSFSMIHKTEYIRKVEYAYLIIKLNPNDLEVNIDELVITNPYTQGLILLMKAMRKGKDGVKTEYEEAIKYLYHIRFYYVEGILNYCGFLKSTNDPDYTKWLQTGKDLANKHYYRFLLHQFNSLDTGVYKEYDENNYPLPEKIDYTNLYKKYKIKG